MPLNASIIVPSWCLFAWVAAGAMYRAVLWSFDSQLGRMEETSQEGWGAMPATEGLHARLYDATPVGAGQN